MIKEPLIINFIHTINNMIITLYMIIIQTDYNLESIIYDHLLELPTAAEDKPALQTRLVFLINVNLIHFFELTVQYSRTTRLTYK